MTAKRKKLVANIAFYTLIAVIYGFVIFLLITKFNGGTVYLFNNRYDVVLTDSMSEKNENHLDFLEGTTQIQAFDVVRSEKIRDDTEIKEKDIVLFTNPDLNNATVMHRVVRVIEEGDTLKVSGVNLKEYHATPGLEFINYSSSINLTKLDVTKITLEFISPNTYNEDYAFNYGGTYYASSVVTTELDGFYKHVVTCTRDSSAPMRTMIVKVNELESYVTSVTYERANGQTLTFTVDQYVESPDGYKKIYNSYFLYEIRGDKAKDSDGIFQRDKLISKVNGVTPKLGYVVRFLTSLPGLLMLIGLGIVISVGSYFYNKAKNAEIKSRAAATVDEQPLDDKKEDKHEETNDS